MMLDDELPGEFERLHRFILYHLGRFTLGLARVNDPRQRDGIIDSLADVLAADDVRLVRVDLSNRHPDDLRQGVQGDAEGRAALADPARAALAIVGLEHLLAAPPGKSGRPPFAAALNLERDLLRQALPLPLIFFLTDFAMDRLLLAAPDFADWHSGVFRFALAGPGAAINMTTTPTTPDARPEPAATPLSPQTVAERLELLEERRHDLARSGPAARPRLAQILKEMGDIHAARQETHDRQQAVPYLVEAAQIFQEAGDKKAKADTLAQLGKVYYWIDKYDQARARYEAALPLYREIGDRLGEAFVFNGLASVEEEEEDWETTLALYSKAISIVPDIPADKAMLIRNRASALISLNRLEEAQADCAAASRLAPDHAFTHGRWADLYLARGEWAEAESRYRQAIAADNGNADWQFDLAAALWGQGQTAEGWAEFEAALALADADKVKAAVRDYGRLHTLFPTLSPLAEALARLETEGR